MSRLDQYGNKPDALSNRRSVPVTTGVTTVFGGFFTQFGALFFTFGMIFWWVFGANIDVTSWVHFLDDTAQTAGVVTSVKSTAWSEGGDDDTPGTPIYEVNYSYVVEGRTYTGIAYEVGSGHGEGSNVAVEFVSDDPRYSRVDGLRKGILAPWALFVAVFPLIGLVFLALGVRKGLHALRILRIGKLTRGRMIDKKPTNTRINKQMVYRYTFEFEDESGNTHTVTAKTHHTQTVEDEPTEQILYNPENPSDGRVVDSLPGRPSISADGELTATSPLKAFARVLLPVGGLAAHVAVAFIFFV